ncbi:MAG: sulfatase-like hydrolase/transferase, partial [Acidobacteria bacterium]|nr:sulfatase-like hydrolase/transferase [Acidobacteriota bacterium]
LYAGEVTLVDRWVGFLLDRIATLGLLENTAVIFVSDHGFYLGEHGYIGKSLLRRDAYQSLPLYPEVARIPMLIYFPAIRQLTDSRMEALVQPVDVTATVLDLLGVQKPASIEGASLVPLLEGRASKIKDIAIGSPTLFQNAETPPSPADRSSITDGEWLLIFGPRLDETARERYTASVDSIVRKVKEEQGEIHPELFNLERDPICEKNLFGSEPAVAARLHAAYIEFLESKDYPRERLEMFRHLEGS